MTTIRTLEVKKTDLAETHVMTHEAGRIDEGEARLEVEFFGLTANNVTYGIVGEQIGYWGFFPSSRQGWGVIPVWGFGRVIESASPELRVGERLYGYFPMSSHLTIRPRRKGGQVTDITNHRSSLPATYNRYRLVAEDPPSVKTRENARAVLFPLFATSYIIADWLSDEGWYGAEQVVVTSASSKTGFGVAMAARGLGGNRPRLVGVTSAGNKDFVRELDVFDEVFGYDEIAALPKARTALVDMSGDAKVITAVHERIGDDIAVSSVVGVTHWQAPRQEQPLPGAKPTLFFAPAQIEKREKELGPGVLMGRALEAWARMTDALEGHMNFERHGGSSAVEAIWKKSVAGEVSPRTGILCHMREG